VHMGNDALYSVLAFLKDGVRIAEEQDCPLATRPGGASCRAMEITSWSICHLRIACVVDRCTCLGVSLPMIEAFLLGQTKFPYPAASIFRDRVSHDGRFRPNN
jgi:hypothetical protein